MSISLPFGRRGQPLAATALPSRVRLVGVAAALAFAVAAERALDSGNEALAIVPGTTHLERALNPGVTHIDSAIVGYVGMALAALALAWLVPLPRAPEAVASRSTRSALTPAPPSPRTWVRLAAAGLVWVYLVVRLLEKDHAWYFPLFLVGAAAIPTALLIRHDLASGVRFRFTASTSELALLAALCATAVALVTYRLSEVPDGIWGDEGAFWEAARAISRHEGPIDLFSPGVYGFPSASSAYQAVFVRWFGESIWSWRASSAFAVVATMIPLYFLARRGFGRRVAFISIVLLATSPFALAFGRLGYNNAQALFPVTLAALLVTAAVDRRSAVLFWASGVVAGLGFYTYFADRISVILIAAVVAHALWTRRLTLTESLSGLALAAAGTIAVGILPTIRTVAEGSEYLNRKMIEGLFANAFYVRAMFPNAPVDSFPSMRVAGVDIVFDPGVWVRLLGRGTLRTLLAFHRTDLVEHHYISGSLGGPWVSALILPGVALLAKRLRQPGPALMLAWLASAIVLLGILSAFPPAQAHLVTILPALAVLYAATLVWLTDALLGWLARHRALASNIVLSAAVTALAVVGAREYFSNANRLFPPPVDILVWFEAMDVRQGERVAFVYGDPTFDEWVPWGIEWFDLEDRYVPLREDSLSTDAAAEALRTARVVVVDARDGQARFDRVRELLADWPMKARLSRGGAPIAWIFSRPEP